MKFNSCFQHANTLLFSPVVGHGLAVNFPNGRGFVFIDIHRLEAVLLLEHAISLGKIILLFFRHLIGTGHKQRRIAVRQQVQELTVELPRNVVIKNAHAVGIAHIKRFVLRKSECKGVDTHFLRFFPFPAACVIADAIELHKPCAKVRNGIATYEIHIPRSLADETIQIQGDFGIGFRLVIKMPAVDFCDGLVHILTPGTEQIGGGEIVLEQLIAPCFYFFNVGPDVFLHGGDGRIQILTLSATQDAHFGCHFFVLSFKKTNPQTGTRAACTDFICHLFHIAESLVHYPRTRTGVNLPAVVNDLEGTVVKSLSKKRLKTRIGSNLLVAALSVGIIPVVPAVNRLFRQNRIVAKLFAISVQAGVNIGRIKRCIHKGTQVNPSAVEGHAIAAVAAVNQRFDSCFGVVEADKCIRLRFHTEAKAFFFVGCNKIPRQPATEVFELCKFKLPVAAFPHITEYIQVGITFKRPVEFNKFHLVFGCSDKQVKGVSVDDRFDKGIGRDLFADDIFGKIMDIENHGCTSVTFLIHFIIQNKTEICNIKSSFLQTANECGRIKTKIKMKRNSAMLFSQTTISGLQVQNRIIRSATHDGLADENGAPDEKLIAKYEHLAKNEVGCIISGYAAVSRNGVSPYPRMLTIFDDSGLTQYKKLTAAVHKHNTPIVLQLAHCGRQTSSKAIGMQKVAPSNVLHTFYPDKAKALTDEGIYGIVNDFIAAAQRAEQAGFDAVQLHGGHGYLLHDFLSPFGNRRTDKWGGSLENRTRIVALIIKGIKENTHLPVWIKLSAEDNRKNGMRIADAVEICQRLEEAGCDAIEVSCGTVQDGMNTMRSKLMPMEAVFRYREPCASFPKWVNAIALPAAKLVNPLIKQPSPLENFNVENAQVIKKAVSIPVIVVGGIHDKDDMQEIIKSGKADFVSMCRPFICEPDLAKKMKNGQIKARCIMCNYCGLVIEKEPTRCLYGKIR